MSTEEGSRASGTGSGKGKLPEETTYLTTCTPVPTPAPGFGGGILTSSVKEHRANVPVEQRGGEEETSIAAGAGTS